VRVDLVLNADDPPLRAGMTATVSIDTGHQHTLAELWGGGSAAAPVTSQDGSHGQPNG
jgi:membrane fusion protein, multidrug efflux system